METSLITNKKMFVITANPETFMLGLKNQDMDKALTNDEAIIVPDGIGVLKAVQRMGNDIHERITGVDIAEYLLKYGNTHNKKIYIYGCTQEVLDLLSKKLASTYPNLNVVGIKNGYDNDEKDVFEDIKYQSPDIILIALGIPKQEILIQKYYRTFDKGIFIGIGGALDVLSGYKKRAPKIFIKLNLEWLYRIAKEPCRIKRFLKNNVVFVKTAKNIIKSMEN